MVKIETLVITKKGNQFSILLPAKRVICWGCNGKGTHVNRAIDGHGLSPEDFAEDPDFAESYFAGVYDVTCEDCGGRRVLEVLNYEALTTKMLERVYRAELEEKRNWAEGEGERKWGC